MPEAPPALVTAATAIAGDVPVYLDQIGKIQAMDVVSIVPQVGGKIIAAHIEDGAYVKKGDLLFEIDPRPFEAALASAQASLAESKAQMDLARIEFSRFEAAVSSAAVSQLEYDQKKGALAVAEAQVAVGEAAVQTAKLNLAYARIHSPIDGRAGARLVHSGNVVKENNEPLLVIQRLDPIYAEFTVTENDLNTVRQAIAAMGGSDLSDSSGRGLKVEVSIPDASARVLSAPGSAKAATRPEGHRAGPREGVLTFLDNLVQTASGTIKLRATVPNADHYFWPGQFVNVRLVLATKKDAVLIPAEAEQIGQQGPYVYVVNAKDGTAELRPIVPGQRQDDLLVVEQGVRPGEPVVVTGQMSVKPNGRIRLAHDGPPSALPGATRPVTGPGTR